MNFTKYLHILIQDKIPNCYLAVDYDGRIYCYQNKPIYHYHYNMFLPLGNEYFFLIGMTLDNVTPQWCKVENCVIVETEEIHITNVWQAYGKRQVNR